MEIKNNLPKIALGLGVSAVVLAIYSVQKQNGSYNNGYLPETGPLQTINAKEIATTLYDAMKTINYTNKEKNDTILTALSNLTQAQFGQVVKAFGLRAYNPVMGNTYQYLWFKIQKHSLPYWLKYELNQPEYQLLKNRFSKYL